MQYLRQDQRLKVLDEMSTDRQRQRVVGKPPVLSQGDSTHARHNARARFNVGRGKVDYSEAGSVLSEGIGSQLSLCETDTSLLIPAFYQESDTHLTDKPATAGDFSENHPQVAGRSMGILRSSRKPKHGDDARLRQVRERQSRGRRDIIKTSSTLLLKAIRLAMHESVEDIVRTQSQPDALSRRTPCATVHDLVSVASRVSSNPKVMVSLLDLIVQPLSAAV
jgi:hypothetical protein